MSPSTIPFLLHLAPLSPSEIPAHPSIPYSSPSSASDGAIDARPSLSLFLHAALTQARDFITTTVPGESFTADRKLYDSPPSSTPVQISSGTVKYTPLASKNPAAPQKEDKWFARRTVLDNRTTTGNASFQEFVEGLKDSHLMNEMEYEPNITAVEEVAKWDCSGVEVEGGWSGVGASREYLWNALFLILCFSPFFLSFFFKKIIMCPQLSFSDNLLQPIHLLPLFYHFARSFRLMNAQSPL